MKISNQSDVSTLVFGYERYSSQLNLSANFPLIAGYRKHDGLTTYSYGAGIMVKKYLLKEMQGGYPFVLAQAFKSKNTEYVYNRGRIPQNIAVTHLVTEVGLGYGYLWRWKQLILDWNLGGRLEFDGNNTEIKLLGNIMIGFPF